MTDKALTKPHYLPGDKQSRYDLASLLRVNHAGEYGAVRIYQGQIAAHKGDKRELLEHMLEQEQQHLQTFNEYLKHYHVRPSLLSPLWYWGGYALGYVTARMGDEVALACTEAVESVIDEHYAEQIDALDNHPPDPHDKTLRDTLEKFRQQEAEHHDMAIEHGAQKAPAHTLIVALIGGLSRLSIGLAKRL